MKTFETTINDFRQKNNLEYQTVQQLFKFLEKLGVAKPVRKIAPEGGKGKPSTVWEVHQELHISLLTLAMKGDGSNAGQ